MKIVIMELRQYFDCHNSFQPREKVTHATKNLCNFIKIDLALIYEFLWYK